MASTKTPRRSVRTPKRADDKRGKNPASLANLAPPWKKGDPSPNPSGRPKLLGESYKTYLAKINPADPEQRTNAELIAAAIGLAAMQGDVSAAREIRSATEGETLTATVTTPPEVFNHAVIIGLLSTRPNGDSTPRGENQSGSDGAAVGQNDDERAV